MMLHRRLALTIPLLLMLTALPTWAHSPVKSTEPANGSTLSAPPAHITLHFGKAATLTRLVEEHPDGTKTDVPFDPAAATKTWTVPFSADRSGSYQMRWRALSADGHPVTGTFTFTVTQ